MLESNRRLTQYANNRSNSTRTYNIGPRPVPFRRTAQDLSGYFEVKGIGVGYDNGFACMNTSKTVCDSVMLSKTVPQKEINHSEQGKVSKNKEGKMEDEPEGERIIKKEGKTSTAEHQISIQPETGQGSTSNNSRDANTNQSDESKNEDAQQKVNEIGTRDQVDTGIAVPDAERPLNDDWQHRQ